MTRDISKWGGIILLLLMLASIIYGIADKNKADDELKNYDSVVAVISERVPGRSAATVSVNYTYKGVLMHSNFQDGSGNFEVGDSILLKIAKRYPQKYISVIRKIK